MAHQIIFCQLGSIVLMENLRDLLEGIPYWKHCAASLESCYSGSLTSKFRAHLQPRKKEIAGSEQGAPFTANNRLGFIYSFLPYRILLTPVPAFGIHDQIGQILVKPQNWNSFFQLPTRRNHEKDFNFQCVNEIYNVPLLVSLWTHFQDNLWNADAVYKPPIGFVIIFLFY